MNILANYDVNKYQMQNIQNKTVQPEFKGKRIIGYKDFVAKQFVTQNKGRIALTAFIANLLAFLHIKKQSNTEKELLNMTKNLQTDNEEAKEETFQKLETAILADMEKHFEKIDEANNKYYSKNPDIEAQIKENVEKVMQVINSDERFFKNPTMKVAQERLEYQQKNFSRDKNIGIEKMTDKANAQVRFMKEYLNNELFNKDESINRDLYQTIDMIDSNKQVDFILKYADKHKDNLMALIYDSFRFFGVSKQNYPSDEFVERFVSYSKRCRSDIRFHDGIYRWIETPKTQEDEKKITQAIDYYFGGLMPFEKMYEIVNSVEYYKR